MTARPRNPAGPGENPTFRPKTLLQRPTTDEREMTEIEVG
jgi:hypothetical protein